MKNKGLLIMLAAAAALLAACQGNPRGARVAAKDASVNIGADPRSMDPSLATDLSSARAILCFARGLTTLDDHGKPRPELAESWTVSPDGLVYEFKLRPAKWSNGEPLTAQDFVYTWTQRMLNPKLGAEYAYQLYYYIKGALEFYQNQELGPQSVGVQAVAPNRLRVTLKAPTPFFPSLVSHHSYLPVSEKTDRANHDWALKAETYVGCGPFILESYTPSLELVGRKNPNYWDAAHVSLERLTLRMIEREDTEQIAFDNGEIDATNLVPRAELDALRGKPELRFTPQYATYWLHLNCEAPVFKDVRVRRALALALDRATIVQNVTRAGERVAFNVTPPELYKQQPAATFKDAQPEEARRLLAEAGYPKGQGFPRLQYIYNTLEIHQAIAQVVQETWARELGISMEIQNQEFKVLINNRRSGKFDVARGGWQADFADPINFLEIFDSRSDNNDSHWKDARYDAMLAAARSEADPARREDLLRQAEVYLMEQMPAIPIYFQTVPYLCAPELEGYVINPMGLFDATEMIWKPGK